MRGRRVVTAILLVSLVVLASAGPASASGAGRLRRLMQRNSGYSPTEQRYWRQRWAAENSGTAIEAAVDSGAEMGVTTAAIFYSQEQFALANANLGPFPGNSFWGTSRWQGRRRHAA